MFSGYPQAWNFFTYFCSLYKINLIFKSLEVVDIGVYCSLKWTLSSNQSHLSFLGTADPSCAWIKMAYHGSVLGINNPFVLKQISEIQQEFISAAGLLITLLLCCINGGKFPLCNGDEDCCSPIVIYSVLYCAEISLPCLGCFSSWFFVMISFCCHWFWKELLGKALLVNHLLPNVCQCRGNSSPSEQGHRGIKSTQEMTGGCWSLALIVHFTCCK